MILGGVLQHALGIKWAMFIGCFLVSLSTLGGYYAVNNYFVLCATYGVLFGLGVGIAYSSPMTAGTISSSVRCSYEVAAQPPWSRKRFYRAGFWTGISDFQLRGDLRH